MNLDAEELQKKFQTIFEKKFQREKELFIISRDDAYFRSCCISKKGK